MDTSIVDKNKLQNTQQIHDANCKSTLEVFLFCLIMQIFYQRRFENLLIVNFQI